MVLLVLMWGGFIVCGLLMGCVSPTAPSDGERFTGLSAAQLAQANAWFDQVRVCADAPTAEPQGVKIIFVAGKTDAAFPDGRPSFVCPEGNYTGGEVGGCLVNHSRMYVLDWSMGPGWSESFGHESVHLARWLATGNDDAKHAGPYWVNGRACQAGLR
jgi:hypothetical protein